MFLCCCWSLNCCWWFWPPFPCSPQHVYLVPCKLGMELSKGRAFSGSHSQIVEEAPSCWSSHHSTELQSTAEHFPVTSPGKAGKEIFSGWLSGLQVPFSICTLMVFLLWSEHRVCFSSPSRVSLSFQMLPVRRSLVETIDLDPEGKASLGAAMEVAGSLSMIGIYLWCCFCKQFTGRHIWGWSARRPWWLWAVMFAAAVSAPRVRRRSSLAPGQSWSVCGLASQGEQTGPV